MVQAGMDVKKVLDKLRVAILAENGFEQSELAEPRRALDDVGAETFILSPPPNKEIKGWQHTNWGESFMVDKPLDADTSAADYDALLLPGGVMNPDKLRMNRDAVRVVTEFMEMGKPIAAICHGPILLIEANVLKNRTVTSWPAIKTDLENAGANWVDKEVALDKNLVTSRKPDDIPAFNKAMIELFAVQPVGAVYS
jgi:protease I